MAKGPTTLSEVREQEYTRSVILAAWGIGLIIVGVLVIAFLHYLVPPHVMLVSRVLVGLAVFAGAALVAVAGKNIVDLKYRATVLFKCPYCDAFNKLVATPTENFECDSCLATIRFENGKMVPVRTISCSNCGAEHRVSVKAERYVCDRCNAVIQIQQLTDPVYGMAPGATQKPRQPAMVLGGGNQNVLLTSVQRSREQQNAVLLQRELGVDLPEARRLLGTITDRTPLIVGYDLPFDQADGLRLQFEQLGSTVVVRATVTSHQ